MTLRRLLEAASDVRGLRGAAFLRGSLASLLAGFYLFHVSLRDFLWGPNGQVPWSAFAADAQGDPFALHRLSASPIWSETLYWLAVAVAIAYALGAWTRLTAPAFALTAHAMIVRNAAAADGGLHLLANLALLLCFTQNGRYFALSRFRDRSHTTPLARAVHGAAMFTIAAQVCFVYAWSEFYKLSGALWTHGTALYYVLHTDRFSTPLAFLVAGNDGLIVAGTYATLVLQGAFPFLMWVPRAKPYLIGIAIVFHLGVASLMGLVLFSAIMVAADLALLTDAQFAQLDESLRRVLLLLRRTLVLPHWLVK